MGWQARLLATLAVALLVSLALAILLARGPLELVARTRTFELDVPTSRP